MPWNYKHTIAAGAAALTGLLGSIGGFLGADYTRQPQSPPQRPPGIEVLISSPGSKTTSSFSYYTPGEAIVGLRGDKINFGDGKSEANYIAIPSDKDSRPNLPPPGFKGIWLDQGNSFNASGSGIAFGYFGPGYNSTGATNPATVVIETVLIKGAILEKMEVGEATLQSMNVKGMNVTRAEFGQVEVAGPAAPSGKNGSRPRKKSK